MNMKKIAVDLFLYGVEEVKPSKLIPESVSITDRLLKISHDTYRLNKKVHIFGSGKASVEMAKAIEKAIPEWIEGGVVVCNYYEKLKKIEVLVGSHPIPDEESVKSAQILKDQMSSLREDDFFIYLLSGGSSSLIEIPISPITIEDLKKTTKLLLEHSVPIDEINVIRKHISLIKGGRLGHSTKASGTVLVISDVIGDDLFTIGSAPLYYDKSTYKDAADILKKHKILDKIPSSVKEVLEKGINREIDETPKSENPRIKHYIIGNNMKALKKIKEKAEKLFPAHIITSQLHGEAKEVAKVILSIGKEISKTKNPFPPPVCLLFGGETTVTVRGKGKGGRNQELCLSALLEMKNKNITVLSGGTDGIDGNSDAAGAVVDGETYKKAQKLGLDINSYLENNDSNTFFKQVGGVIETGYTGTNVMDITILIVGGER